MPSSAAQHERLISPVSLVLIAALFVIAFALLAPARHTYLFGGLAGSGSRGGVQSVDGTGSVSGRVDALEIAYLKAHMALGDLSDDEVAGAITPLLRAGRWQEVRELLDAYPNVTPTPHERQSIALEVAAAALVDATGTDAQADRQALFIEEFDKLIADPAAGDVETLARAVELSLPLDDAGQTSRLIERMLEEPLGGESLERLARTALAVQRPDTAHRVLARLAEEHPDRRSHWLQEAARWAEAAGSHTAAIDYLESLERDEAVRQGSAIERRRTTLMIAAGRNEEARDRLEIRVERDPDDTESRLQLAQVLEWTGNPVAAADHWQWLVAQAPDADKLLELARLAELNLEPGIAARALRKLVMLQVPDDIVVTRLVSLYERDGRMEEAATVLQDIIDRHGSSRHRLRSLATLQQRHLNFRASIEAWEQFAQAFGASSEETLSRMELHWRLNEPWRAATLAARFDGSALGDEATDYRLRLLSETGWRYRQPWLHRLVVPKIGQIEDATARALAGNRLVSALQDHCSDGEALQAARQLWTDTAETDFALAAMELALDQDDRAALAEFMDVERQPEALRRLPDYWTLLGTARRRAGDRTAASASYHQALALDPRLASAVVGLVQLHLDGRNRAALDTLVGNFRTTAESDPEVWSFLAKAYLGFHDPLSGLRWLSRLIGGGRADQQLLAGYARALEGQGLTAAAGDLHRVMREQERRWQAVEYVLAPAGSDEPSAPWRGGAQKAGLCFS